MGTSTDMVLYHNPHCSKSREALAFLRELGLQPTVVEYLKHPPSRSTLQARFGRSVNKYRFRLIVIIMS